jgi:hypothetical protein
MAWQTPKTDWDTSDNPGPGDFNRIEDNLLSLVSILTGQISNGGTIPLPDGYTEDQCHWMVSPCSITMGADITHIHCSANGTRTVTCYSIRSSGDDPVHVSGTANYMIIGVKQ